MKYFIWLVIIAAVVIWLKRFKNKITQAGMGNAASAKPQAPHAVQQEGGGERMVQCAQCGLHFPASEAVTNGAGTIFCSEEHQRLSS